MDVPGGGRSGVSTYCKGSGSHHRSAFAGDGQLLPGAPLISVINSTGSQKGW